MNLDDRFPISDNTCSDEELSCSTCGAVVIGISGAVTHNEWHEELEKKLDTLLKLS